MSKKAPLRLDDAVEYLMRESSVDNLLKRFPEIESIEYEFVGGAKAYGSSLIPIIALHDCPKAILTSPGQYEVILIGKEKLMDTICYRDLPNAVSHAVHQLGRDIFSRPERNFVITMAVIGTGTSLYLYEYSQDDLQKFYEDIKSHGFETCNQIMPLEVDNPPLATSAMREIRVNGFDDSEAFLKDILDSSQKAVNLQRKYFFSEKKYHSALNKAMISSGWIFPDKADSVNCLGSRVSGYPI
jgi:hypothetical protein